MFSSLLEIDSPSFFHNTGAVAATFVFVGLAAASILLFILFAVRRRRRNRRIEHDAAVEATLAAAGFRRTPLDDDDDRENNSRHSKMAMAQRSLGAGTASSLPSVGRTSAYIDSPNHDEIEGFNPYTDYVVPPSGYVPARSSSPPPGIFVGAYRDVENSPDRIVNHNHTASGSNEPLLASFHRATASSPPLAQDGVNPPTPPPRNPQRIADRTSSDAPRAGPSSPMPRTEDRNRSATPSMYSFESSGDDRLDPVLRQRMKDEKQSATTRELRDDEDYSRPVLGVCHTILHCNFDSLFFAGP